MFHRKAMQRNHNIREEVTLVRDDAVNTI